MAVRVSTDDLRAVVITEQDDLTSYITTASLVVDELLVGKGLTDARLKQIELYLAGHLVALRTPTSRLTDISVDDIKQTLGGQYGSGLKATLQGQMALQLDSTATLAGLQANQDKPPQLGQFTVLV